MQNNNKINSSEIKNEKKFDAVFSVIILQISVIIIVLTGLLAVKFTDKNLFSKLENKYKSEFCTQIKISELIKSDPPLSEGYVVKVE